MRSITKGNEPPSLAQHRQTPFSDYDNFPHKNVLRQALVAEQRDLCCYCMRRINPSPEVMKIEHWKCQAKHPTEQLSYRNLLAACMGGEGQPSKNQHCDTRKGNRALRWNPAEPSHQIESRILYELDGSIHGNEALFDHQLNDVLNLNLSFLKQERKSVLNGLLGWWALEKARLKGPVPRRRLIRMRDKCIAGSGQLGPYCQVTVWWLDQKIGR